MAVLRGGKARLDEVEHFGASIVFQVEAPSRVFQNVPRLAMPNEMRTLSSTPCHGSTFCIIAITPVRILKTDVIRLRLKLTRRVRAGKSSSITPRETKLSHMLTLGL